MGEIAATQKRGAYKCLHRQDVGKMYSFYNIVVVGNTVIDVDHFFCQPEKNNEKSADCVLHLLIFSYHKKV